MGIYILEKNLKGNMGSGGIILRSCTSNRLAMMSRIKNFIWIFYSQYLEYSVKNKSEFSFTLSFRFFKILIIKRLIKKIKQYSKYFSINIVNK